MLRVGLATSVAMGVLATACGSVAQTQGSTPTTPSATVAGEASVAEVVVTAQRRNENLQNVPISVTALSAKALAATGIQNTQDLAVVTPGLTFPSSLGSALPHIRGVGSTAVAPGAENSIALYVDGVYYASAAGSILSLNNVSRVEILKGPQGTLFGRNATGGLIQVVTNDPKDVLEGRAALTYGNYDTSREELYITGPIAPTVSADLAAQVGHQGDGWGTNVATGKDVYKTDLDLSLRSKILWTPNADTHVRLSMDYENVRSSQDAVFQIPGTFNPFYPPAEFHRKNYDVDLNLQPVIRQESGGVSLRADHDFGFADFITTTAYRQQKFFFTVDFDSGPLPILDDLSSQSDKQITQEFQLQSHKGGPLQWSLGLFYFHAEDGFDPVSLRFSGGAVQPVGPGLGLTKLDANATQTTDSVAGYGQATYDLGSRTQITAGLRLTYESKALDGVQTATLNGVIPVVLANAHDSFDVTKPTWRLAIDHKFSDHILGYISYNRGFKSGGYNPSVPGSTPYQTEELDAYEVGLKSELFDRHVRLNGSAFYYDYSNIQVSRFVNGVPLVYNGASARIYGFDVDLDWAVTRNLTIGGGLEALNDQFTAFPCADFLVGGPMLSSAACPGAGTPSLPYGRSAKGNSLPTTPDLSANLTVDYKMTLLNGQADFGVNGSYNSGYFYDPANTLEQPGYYVVNASALWTAPDDRYSVRLWIKNLADARYTVEKAGAPTGFIEALAAPRTFGVTLSTRF